MPSQLVNFANLKENTFWLFLPAWLCSSICAQHNVFSLMVIKKCLGRKRKFFLSATVLIPIQCHNQVEMSFVRNNETGNKLHWAALHWDEMLQAKRNEAHCFPIVPRLTHDWAATKKLSRQGSAQSLSASINLRKNRKFKIKRQIWYRWFFQKLFLICFRGSIFPENYDSVSFLKLKCVSLGHFPIT